MKKFLVVIGLISVGLMLSACGSKPATTHMNHNSKNMVEPGTAAAGGGSYLDEAIPADVLSLKLFDQNGKSFTLGSFKGKYLVITNFLTSCQEICPMTTANVRAIGEAVGASNAKDLVKVIEISVDAERDTASRIKAYFDLYESQTFSLASGSSADLKKLWAYFGAPAMRMEFTPKESAALPMDWQTGKPSTYDMSHPDLVLIVGPDSHWKWIDLGNPNPGKAVIPEKLKAFLSEDGLKHLAKPEEPFWTTDAVFAALHDLTGVHIA